MVQVCDHERCDHHNGRVNQPHVALLDAEPHRGHAHEEEYAVLVHPTQPELPFGIITIMVVVERRADGSYDSAQGMEQQTRVLVQGSEDQRYD
jgi:hypothetical protein